MKRFTVTFDVKGQNYSDVNYRNRKQKCESELIRNYIEVCYMEVDMEALMPIQ